MTVKEIAKLTGKAERTIRTWASLAKIAEVSAKMAKAIQSNVPADFTLDETIGIMKSGTVSESLIDLLIENAKNKNSIIEKKSNLTEFDFEMIARVTSKIISEILDKKIDDKIEKKFESKQSLLPAPQKNDRDNVNQIVREYSVKKGIEYSKVWGMLYSEFYYRVHRNVRVCAKNQEMGIIDYIETEGLMPELLAIALDYLK